MKILMMLPLFLLPSLVQAAGNFACVRNQAEEPAAFVLTAGGEEYAFTVRGDETYCQPIAAEVKTFNLAYSGAHNQYCQATDLSINEWLRVSKSPDGAIACSREGSTDTKPLHTTWYKSFLLRTWYNAPKVANKQIEQNGDASNCGDAPPYRWDNVGDFVKIDLRINAGGSCFFETSAVNLIFKADGRRVGELRCAQNVISWPPFCKWDFLDRNSGFSGHTDNGGDFENIYFYGSR